MAGGRIIASGTPGELKQRVSDGGVMEVEVFGLPEGALRLVESVPGVRGVSVTERGQAQLVLIHADPDVEVAPRVLQCFHGSRVGRVATREPTLEDAYVDLVRSS